MEIIIFIILVALTAFFSAAETAFMSLHASRVRLLKQENAWNAKLIERLRRDPERLLITILLGSNIVVLSTGSYAALIATQIFHSISLGVVTGITTVIVLLLGEMIPKSIAFAKNVATAQLFAWPLYVFSVISWPITWALVGFNTQVNKIFGVTHSGHISEEEVRIMSRMSAEHGGIGYDEHTLIENIFKFDDIVVGSIMTPFPRVHFVDGSVPIDQIAHYIGETEHSRYPVYEGSEENIIGYIHANTVMKVLNSSDRDFPVSRFVRPIARIDESMSLERAFRAMNRRQAHMYLVHAKDEPKKIIGLVTLEDILEQLVGEIEDETDRAIA